MTDRYEEWRNFYAEKVRSWMSLEELRAECGKLTTTDATSPEVLLIHAMHLLERYEPRMKTLGAQKGVVAWARQVYARPVNAPEPAGEWDELVDIEFHNRPEKPEGEGWRPLVLADTGDGAAPLMMEEREKRDEARVMADKLTTELAACDVARPPTPVGWSDTDWIKHLQDQEPHPLAGLHINQGSMNAAADAYEAEYNAAQEARRAEHDAARKEGCMTEDRDDRIERGRTAEEKAAALEPWGYEPDVDAATMLRLIKTIKYLVGIAERGEGRKIADDETPEQFVLGYVKRLEQTNQDASAKLRERNGGRA